MFPFDYDEWPSNSTNNEFIQRPYSGSIFEIRSKFEKIFPEEKFHEVGKTIGKKTQVFKIKYSLNLLTDYGLHAELDSEGVVKEYMNEKTNLMEYIDERNDLELYTSYTMMNLTRYKWENLGFNWHLINVLFNVMYVI
jgi:hypothetical protein